MLALLENNAYNTFSAFTASTASTTLLTLLTLFTLFSLLKHCVQSGLYAYIYIAICLERSADLAIWLYGPWLAQKNWDGWSEYPHTLL